MDYVSGEASYEYGAHSHSYVGSSVPHRPFLSSNRPSRSLAKTITIVQPHAVKPGVQGLKPKFKQLVKEWRAATMFESSPIAIATHPSYQRIIALGAPALPLVINELRKNGGLWFWALRFMADHDPVPPEHRGDYERMRKFWLDWWKAQEASYV